MANEPAPLTSKSYIVGMCTSTSLSIAVQDWFGRDSYVELVSQHWVHMSWGWGASAFVITIIVQAFLAAEEQRRLSSSKKLYDRKLPRLH